MAAPSLSSDSSTNPWSGPSTIFAPSDSSLHTCLSCSIPNILREHIIPGLYTIDYLRKLAFGTKIETLSPGRCLTVTSTSIENATASATVEKVFIGGVEITHPDLFNNDRSSRQIHNQPLAQPAILRLMLRDAMLRLRNNGFSILSLAMRVKYAELASLNNMTVFALDDASIFSGSHSYISSVSVYLPFPRIHPAAAGFDGILGEDLDGGDHAVVDGACSAVTEEGGSCGGVRMT
ncbi:hypothetical protein GH714_018893 [Hevea brasiliensis]|uniref:FAS1 domain-containing protein n=1 Tax=Hevea brasiliensis TaxID=3981 RepID=A0A6A6K7N1_HEVBR|nr:hypothetical protein GH714_018893 [Hevea brasiliensis]